MFCSGIISCCNWTRNSGTRISTCLNLASATTVYKAVIYLVIADLGRSTVPIQLADLIGALVTSVDTLNTAPVTVWTIVIGFAVVYLVSEDANVTAA